MDAGSVPSPKDTSLDDPDDPEPNLAWHAFDQSGGGPANALVFSALSGFAPGVFYASVNWTNPPDDATAIYLAGTWDCYSCTDLVIDATNRAQWTRLLPRRPADTLLDEICAQKGGWLDVEKEECKLLVPMPAGSQSWDSLWDVCAATSTDGDGFRVSLTAHIKPSFMPGRVSEGDSRFRDAWDT